MWHSLPWRPRINRLYKHRKKFANLKKKILYFNLCQNRKFQEMRLNNRNLIKMVTRLCKIFWVSNRLVWPVATCISASWGMKFSCRRLTNIKCFQSIKMLNIRINAMGWYRGMELILIKVLQEIIMKIGLRLFWILWNLRVRRLMRYGRSAAFLAFMMAMEDLLVLIF